MSHAGDHVVDTHAFIWHLGARSRLSAQVQAILNDADAGNSLIFVPSIALVEIIYLAERGRVPADLLGRMFDFFQRPRGPYRLVALDEAIVRAVHAVPRDLVPDMPDRIIVATALHVGRPLISKDVQITTAGVVPTV